MNLSGDESSDDEGETDSAACDQAFFELRGYLHCGSVRITPRKGEGLGGSTTLELRHYADGAPTDKGLVLRSEGIYALAQLIEHIDSLLDRQAVEDGLWKKRFHLSHDSFFTADGNVKGVHIRTHFVNSRGRVRATREGIFMSPEYARIFASKFSSLLKYCGYLAECRPCTHDGVEEAVSCYACNWIDIQRQIKRK